jgi:hypothetical protein
MKKRFANSDRTKGEDSMNRRIGSETGMVFVLGIALAGTLTGCIGYVDSPHHSRGYAPSRPVYVEQAVVREDYVYYPSYQVYYSGRTRQYVYLEGHSWVSRPAPPRVSAQVVFASPSVRLDFHDHPSNHHAKISREYPKQWAPPGQSPDRKQGHDEHDSRNER